MLRTFFDRRTVRILAGAVVGVPVTVIGAVGAFYGIVIGFGGMFTAGSDSFFFFYISASTFAGIAGICGAWRRLLKPHGKMNRAERRIVRVLLNAGVMSALALAVGAGRFSDTACLSMPFALLSAIGLLLVLATPAEDTNSSFDTDAQARRST